MSILNSIIQILLNILLNMKKEIFVRLIKNYLDFPLQNFVPRNKEFSFFSEIRKVYTIIWPRKAWKTYFLYQIIDNLIKSWVKKENTLYVYLENDEIFPVELRDLNAILETYFEIVWFDRNQKYYIFLDEIQVVENWQKFATKIYQEFKNVELILTWSSSKLLSSEISTGLRWKASKKELLPLSFEEVLKFKNFEIKKYYNFEEEIKLKKIFAEILFYWSYPEIVKIEEKNRKLETIDEYFDLVFYNDIVERFNLKSFKKLKTFRKIILSYMTNFVNFSKLSKDVWVDYNTILNWASYFNQVYFIFELKNFDFSIWKQETSTSKIYILDNSYYILNFWRFKQDYWILFENFVFMELKKLGFKENKDLFYFKNKEFDIDFLVFKNNKPKFIQVVYELNKENFDREIKQLQKLKEKFEGEYYLIYYENKLDFEVEWVNLVKFYEIWNFS